MRYILIYFSGTGNTGLITEEMASQFKAVGNEVEVYSVEEFKDGQTLDLTDAVVGLGFPVYKFTYPEIMERALSLLAKSRAAASKTTPLFVYSTYCRFNATSLHRMAAAAEKVGFALVAQQGFKCPSNGAAALQDYESFAYKSVMYFENRIDLAVKAFARQVEENTELFRSSGYRERHRGTVIDNFKINLVGEIEKWGYPKLEVDSSLCNLCTLCVKRCPEQNLELGEDRVIVKDEVDCLHCLRCMQHCPLHAITFGEQTQGPNRYSLKTCKTLYAEAKERAIDAPEPGTAGVKRAWARKKLLGWLFRKR